METNRNGGTDEWIEPAAAPGPLADDEKADELGQGAPSTGVAAGGETVAGSGHVETMGGVLSGGQDYTAVNLGGSGVGRGDDGHDRGIAASGDEEDADFD